MSTMVDRLALRAVAVASAVLTATALVAGPAAASPTQPPPTVTDWTASHGNASASGTAKTTYKFNLKTVLVAGQVTSSVADECYRVQLIVNHDLASLPRDVVDHCGTGTTGFETGGSGSIATSSFGIRICRISHADAEGTVSCGKTTRVG